LDLPPGTGDIQLTIVQTVPLNGAVIVSTPQRVALADARKGVAMFDQVGVPVLGLVENMAWFTPPELPENRYYLFGKGGARALADELGVPLLAELPIQETIRQNCDDGTPAASEADSLASRAFADLAHAVDEQVILRNATRPATEKVDILHR
jgi:ATP-binding protein involved in chromosome partitioning